MLWMDIWVHPHADIPLEVGVRFLENWGTAAETKWCCCKVMVEAPKARRLHPTSIYLFIIQAVLASWYAVDGHMGAPLRWCTWIFGKLGVWLSLSDDEMSWFSLQSPVDCVKNPYYLYIKCFSTLICRGRAYGSTLTLIPLDGVGFLENWVHGCDRVMLLKGHGWASKAP